MENIIHDVRSNLLNEKSDLTLNSIAKSISDTTHGLLTKEQIILELQKVTREFTGLGKLEIFLNIKNLTDILVVGNQGIYLDYGKGLKKVENIFTSEQEVEQFAIRLAQQSGKRLDKSHPWVDTVIYLSSFNLNIRMHAILKNISKQGTCLSFRLFQKNNMSLNEIMSFDVFKFQLSNILNSILKSKQSFLIVGGTGSGKTTLLNAIISEIEKYERVICIEDTYELQSGNSGRINLISSEILNENKSQINQSNLIIQALRMRPDRIIVGEVRGKEVLDLLTALNTGHSGSGGTIHANSIYEIPARIEAMGYLAGVPREAMHSLLFAAISKIIFVEKRGEQRLITSIGEFEKNKNGFCKVKTVWERNQQ